MKPQKQPDATLCRIVEKLFRERDTLMASKTDVGVGSGSVAAVESSNLASVPQIMYRSLQQTTIPPPHQQRAGGVTNDRIPLQRLNEDEYDEVNLGGGGDNASDDLDEQGQREAKNKRSKRSKRKRKLSEKAPSALDEK